MAELGRRPDTPPAQPDNPPSRAPDRARTPDTPSKGNDDRQAIRDAFRQAEHPAFADPRYEPRARVDARYVTNADAASVRDPSKAIFYETSKDRPERKPGADKPETPAAGTLQVDRPRESPPIDKKDVKLDGPEDSKLGSIDKILAEEVGDVHDGIEGSLNAVDSMLGRLRPTGQHVESSPDHDSAHNPYGHLPTHGSDLGTGVAAMLCTGLFLGEAARLTYRKVAEMREARHARNR